MRHAIAFVLAISALAACGGVGTSDLVSIDQADLKSCGGLTSAHCFCQLEGGPSMSSGGPILPANDEGQILFTYTIPNKCFNQQIDPLLSQQGHGCWLACRNAFGVDGATADPGVRALISQAGQALHAQGACGGWVSAPFNFAAGTNKYRPATNMGIGIGIPGTVVTVNGQQVCR
jgi:hypothetical protein